MQNIPRGGNEGSMGTASVTRQNKFCQGQVRKTTYRMQVILPTLRINEGKIRHIYQRGGVLDVVEGVVEES